MVGRVSPPKTGDLLRDLKRAPLVLLAAVAAVSIQFTK